jgi:hypothetical protein
VANTYPPDYAHLVRDAILAEIPEMGEWIREQPAEGDFKTELRIEIPSANRSMPQSLEVLTYHSEDGSGPPMTDFVWSERWSPDHLLADDDLAGHVQWIANSLKMLLNEESAVFNAWFEGRLTSGGAVVPANKEPFPCGQADWIKVRSWRGTYDRDLTGSWPGWPNDPHDPFYKTL